MWTFAWQNLITRPSRTALAVLGLTIPVLAFLGLFSISRGIRDLMGGTLGTMQSLMVLRENSPSPVFSDLPAGHGEGPAEDPGRARRRPRGLEDRPADRRQGRPRAPPRSAC